MAKLKSKIGNNTYSWTSDDIRDAEITQIKSDLQNLIKIETFSTQATYPGDGRPPFWEIYIAKQNYTPISFSIIYGNTSTTTLGAEFFGTYGMLGGYSSREETVTAYVVYIKSSFLN